MIEKKLSNKMKQLNENIDSLKYQIDLLDKTLRKSIDENEKIRFRMSELEYAINS